MAKRVPRRRLYHENWRYGYRQNSRVGNALAKERHLEWLDNDGHLSSDLAWVNAHGYPETVWGRKRFEVRTWAALSRLRYRAGKAEYRLRVAATAFHDAAARGQSVEWEVKDIRPFQENLPRLEDLMLRLARHAERAWGDDWREHLNIKIVSTMGGGWTKFGARVAWAADRATIPVLVSARGRDRFRREWEPYVTYVRGSLVPVR